MPRPTKTALLLIIFLFFSGLAQAEELRLITEHAPPSSYMKDGKPMGFSVDVVQEIQRRLGDNTEISCLPWARGYKMLLTRPNTLLFAIYRTSQREKLCHWIGPMMEVKWVLYGLKDRVTPISRLEEAKTMGLIGTSRNDAKEQYLKSKGFENLSSATTNRANIQKLARKEINMVVGSNFTPGEIRQVTGIDRDRLVEVFVLRKASIYLAFSLGTDPAILARWTQAFAEMKKDGALNRIIKKYTLD